MPESNKICFVIMGFGKKTDLSTGKTLDLDKTYKNIIQPAAIKAGFQCVRADEIHDSGLIDKSMYALLMHADLVVADITTYNPNVIYELGIRHAVRPYTTIIIKEKDGRIPFDLDHTRIFPYTHLGDDIGADEAKRCQNDLSSLITATTNKQRADSPLYEFINDIEYPKLTPSEYIRIIGDLTEREDSIFAITEKAKLNMKDSKFSDAAKLWVKACDAVPTESYFVQQYALSIYKSKEPTEASSLTDALKIIETLFPDGNTNDPETLGLTGAIYKRMWQIHKDSEYLERAIKYYGKGFQIRNDYYTGENYALCLNMKGADESDEEEKMYYVVAAKKARKQILDILEEISNVDKDDADEKDKWAYATLANCHYGLGNDDNGKKYEEIFLGLTDVVWEIETYKEGRNKVIELTQ